MKDTATRGGEWTARARQVRRYAAAVTRLHGDGVVRRVRDGDEHEARNGREGGLGEVHIVAPRRELKEQEAQGRGGRALRAHAPHGGRHGRQQPVCAARDEQARERNHERRRDKKGKLDAKEEP